MLTESLERNICSAEGSLGQVTTKKKTRNAPLALNRRFSPPPREQNILRSLNIPAQVVQILELMIYRTFDVFAVISSYASAPHPFPCDNMNP